MLNPANSSGLNFRKYTPLLVFLFSDQTQMLYMRMLFRRHDWIPASSLNYTEVGDINVALKELLDRRFIVDSMV